MKTKNLCIAFILSLLALQACTTDDVSLTENNGPGDGSNLYAIKDNAFGEYLKYLGVTGVYSKVSNESGSPVISYVIDTVESKTFTGDINLSKTDASIKKLTTAGLTTAADKITNLDGIQYFTGLNSLALTSNNITSLNLSTLVNLTELKMNFNKVGSLDLSNNTKLTVLNYRGSGEAEEGQKLTAINLTRNTELTTLDLQSHQLLTIDLSQNTKLVSVNLLSNPGVPFSIPEDIYNQLTTREGVESGTPAPPVGEDYYLIPNKAFGEYLNYRLGSEGIVVEENGSYKIDKDKAAAYTGELDLRKRKDDIAVLVTAGLSTANDPITDLSGIECFTQLTVLRLVSNSLPSLDITKLTELTILDLNNNLIASLDLTKNTKLTELSYNASSKAGNGQKLTSIDLTKNTLLTSLTMKSHELTTIDLSKNTGLTSVDLTGNSGAPFTIPAAIFDNLTTAKGVQK